MAKMFYTLAETQEKLRASEAEVKQYIKIGRLREFRDGPRLMFKADQVEYLVPERPKPDLVKLEDDRIGMAPAASHFGLSGSSIGLADSGVGSASFSALDGVGSGLMDLAKESDDTSILAALAYLERSAQKTYKCRGMDSAGREVKQTIEAESEETAIAALRAKGYFPTSVKETVGKPTPPVAEAANGDSKRPSRLWKIVKIAIIFGLGYAVGFGVCFVSLG